MDDLWLGAPPAQATFVFLLPNTPKLPSDANKAYLEVPNVAELVALNGNHWRKIFTIMAKLTAEDAAKWRYHRDNSLFNNIAITFSVDQLVDYKGGLFIVGKTFEDRLPVNGEPVYGGGAQLAHVSLPRVWCPYLDYRQFPNSLIEALRAYILE
ncbi:hypothetical protein J9B83_05975 [Marinomonas sp. A79]|uniref:Uncharacterized protein n=1 Tax=Marinomonas vulgaris TaxID=2823372 RepID=A0ABS5HA35_9GAMM|nr:hypothetical protein [Marinomonas vulgaris]MBR7888485.1 hypothetical protein [Marinomonas vulgaris]